MKKRSAQVPEYTVELAEEVWYHNEFIIDSVGKNVDTLMIDDAINMAIVHISSKPKNEAVIYCNGDVMYSFSNVWDPKQPICIPADSATILSRLIGFTFSPEYKERLNTFFDAHLMSEREYQSCIDCEREDEIWGYTMKQIVDMLNMFERGTMMRVLDIFLTEREQVLGKQE